MKHGGQAFPHWGMGSITHGEITHPAGGPIPLLGMTMRQYYKAAALPLMSVWYGDKDMEFIASACADVADAMLAEDEKADKQEEAR
jgi:hypothetical protein